MDWTPEVIGAVCISIGSALGAIITVLIKWQAQSYALTIKHDEIEYQKAIKGYEIVIQRLDEERKRTNEKFDTLEKEHLQCRVTCERLTAQIGYLTERVHTLEAELSK